MALARLRSAASGSAFATRRASTGRSWDLVRVTALSNNESTTACAFASDRHSVPVTNRCAFG
jgi:hypothetical protein